MKFSEMPYQRPDLEVIKSQIMELTDKLISAIDYPAAKAVFMEKDLLDRHINTLDALASIRHTIDTRDAFYDEEMKFWNNANPQISECNQNWINALLASPFRSDFERDFGMLTFLNAEIDLKTFSSDIMDELATESDLTCEYEKLLASAQIPFNGSVYTLSQLTPFKNDLDDDIRLAAWKAEGRWYKEHQEQFDSIYDKLVRLRDKMGRTLGYDGFTQLGYYRMGRNSYTKEDVAKFREAVVKYLVPVANQIYIAQAERLGKEYPMSFADNALSFRDGNPKPVGTPDDIVAAGKKFYDELSPETSEFFKTMLDMELMDLLSTEGKASGGYCNTLMDYEVPFIFANFNGTQGDVEVITHEAGHAFAGYINRKRVPSSTLWPTLDACEVHSMSMEFFAEAWAEDFFGNDTNKFLYSHLSGALTFIPYGTMVDHFQHIIYEKPELTPAQRHGVWKELLGIYMPWMKLDGDIPFYSEGEGWQRQHHIYSDPFYYIDYCLAQTVALQFWSLIQEDRTSAWERYLTFTRLGGSEVFTELLSQAELGSPFDETCVKTVCEKAAKWLQEFEW